LTTLTFLLSSAAAHAKPSFGVVESSARAGDLVHFTISGVDGNVDYALEVDDMQVLEGTSDGVVSDTFTVPDLGDAVRTVAVEAEIRANGRLKKVETDLDYLGPALPLTGPPTPSTAPAVPVVPQAVPTPEAIHSPEAIEGPPPAPAVTLQSNRRRRQSHKRQVVERPRHAARSRERRRRVHRGSDRRKHHAATRNRRSKRAAPGTPPLFGGITEPGRGQHPATEPTAPRPAVLVATGPRPGLGGGAYPAVVVPVLLGLAALALAGTAMLRRRRLASRRESD
jgi:hypothetical protein